MEFKLLCKYYAEIEATSKRLENIASLANLFREIKTSGAKGELARVIYLTQGYLYPNWQDRSKIGIAEKLLIQALTIPSGRTAQEIRQMIIKYGDVGLAAEIVLRKSSEETGGTGGGKSGASLDKFLPAKPAKAKPAKTAPKKAQATLFSAPTGLQLGDIYSKLEDITKKSGPGSMERKVSMLGGLFARATPLEARYLARIVNVTIRLGVADMTIIAALAEAYAGGRQNKDPVERAYNLYPDLGHIAEVLYESGLEGVKDFQPTVGVPIRMMLASRMNFDEILPKLGGECFSEYKLDGERLQVHKNGKKVQLFSRKLIDISSQYPDVCEDIVKGIKGDQVILEGEVVAMDHFYEKMLPFQVVSRRRRKFDIAKMREEVPVALFAFDLLFCDGTTYIDKPLPERREKLAGILTPSDSLRHVIGKPIKSTEELVSFFKEARAAGTEGIMNKATGPDSVYQAGNRGFLWIKLKGLETAKMVDTLDTVIVGAYHGQGRRVGVFGAFLVATLNDETNLFESFTKVATGFDDVQLQDMQKRVSPLESKIKPKDVVHTADPPDIWIDPKIIIEIAGDEITISPIFECARQLTDLDQGYSVRFPVFQRIREDKDPSQITTSQEVVDIYRLQKG